MPNPPPPFEYDAHKSTAISYAVSNALYPGNAESTERYAYAACVTPARPKVTVAGAGKGRLVHRLKRCVAVWPRFPGWAPRLAAEFDCGAYTAAAVLGAEAEDRPLCPRCDWSGASGSEVVYFAARDGLVKIGCSSRPVPRVAGMRATLLARQPGGFALEAELHERFAADRQYGEWFRPSPALTAYIASLAPAEAVA